MILPAQLASQLLYQLAHPSNEQIGHNHQRGHQPTVNPTRTAMQGNGIQPIQKQDAAINAQLVANNRLAANNANVKFDNTTRQRSMMADNSSLATGLGIKKTDSRWQRESSDSLTEHFSLDIADALEAQALQTLITVTYSLQEAGLFNRFWVGIVYDSHIAIDDIAQVSNKCVLSIAPMDHCSNAANVMDIAAHTTFVVRLNQCQPFAKNLPAQLLSGRHNHCVDWIVMTVDEPLAAGNQQDHYHVYRLSVSAFARKLQGVAMLVGADTSLETGHHLSLHVPGVKSLWRGERVPPAIPRSLEVACTAH